LFTNISPAGASNQRQHLCDAAPRHPVGQPVTITISLLGRRSCATSSVDCAHFSAADADVGTPGFHLAVPDQFLSLRSASSSVAQPFRLFSRDHWALNCRDRRWGWSWFRLHVCARGKHHNSQSCCRTAASCAVEGERRCHVGWSPLLSEQLQTPLG
jgi:hypothetical protein